MLCTDCPLWESELFHNCQSGRGNPHAKVMLVGQGPGGQESLQGKPFVGKSGKLLVKGLGLAGFTTEQWILTNLVACHPKDDSGGNRAPSPREVATCAPRLEELIQIVQPKHIVAVGSVPATNQTIAAARAQDGGKGRFQAR